MLYNLLKIPAKIALTLYCKKLHFNKKEIVIPDGPLLLACNHPNSFLDAILLCTLFDRPVYALARGDAFKKTWIKWLLTQLNILPVYREREGLEHLQKNYDTFENCIDIFKKNGIVLIFSEALCVNEWHLRPLKKGTARLAQSAWLQDIPLQILPIGINYSSFTKFGKNIIINAGDLISKKDFEESLASNGKLLNQITTAIQDQLSGLVHEIKNNDLEKHSNIFSLPTSALKKLWLFLPGLLGWAVHLPFYLPLRMWVQKKALHTGHYDSIILGVCFLGYPIYLGIISMLIFAIGGGWWGFLSFIICPFLVWCWVQRKDVVKVF